VRTTQRPLLTGTLVAAAALVLLAGCGTGNQQSTATQPAPSSSATPATSPQAPAAGERCHTRELGAALQQQRPGGGSRYAVLTLTNRSSRSCPVTGFPGLQLLDSSSRPLPTNVVRNQQQPSQTVQLAPGAAAFTTLHWGLVPGDGEPQTTQCEPTPASVEVTPPDETTHLVIGWTYGPVCQKGRIDLPALAPGTGPTQ
jgi:hypothetical protein